LRPADKEIIIIRGRNLYPADLEMTVQESHPALAAQVAAAFALEVGQQEQLAIVHEVSETLTDEERDDIAGAIRRIVADRHGVQTHTIVFVPSGAIPRIGHGKIGRSACRARLLDRTLRILSEHVLDAASARRNTSFEAPRTPTEQTLAGIWEEALAVPRIGIHEAFADLGADSLLSMAVLMAIEDAGLAVMPEDIHLRGTIASLGATIDARQTANTQKTGPAVGPVPLLLRQVTLLNLGELARTWSVVLTFLEADGSIDARLLEQSFQHLLFYHDALRMRCERSGRSWKAEYTAHTPLGLVSFADLSDLRGEQQEVRVKEEIARLWQSLDVERGSMIRAALIRVRGAGDLVVLAVHHIVADASSISILVRDLDAVYRQLSLGEQPQVPPRTTTVVEWLKNAAAFARSEAGRQEESYWNQLMDHEVAAIPSDYPREHGIVGPQEIAWARLGRERTADLQQIGRAGLTVPAAVHYALARALSELTGTEAVRFWTVSHGRGQLLPNTDLTRTVGYLVHEVPVLLRIGESPDHLEGARMVHAQMEKIPSQGMGFEVLLNFSEDRSRRKLLRGLEMGIRLNFAGDLDRMYRGLEVFHRAEGRGGMLGGGIPPSERHPWHNRLAINARIEEAELYFGITYHSRAYASGTIERFAGRMIEILGQIAEYSGHHPD
jgi:non-ribosomal peptide synthase protein (TIGR01720 family)